MNRLQRVTELTQPALVGRYYLVPTIECSFLGGRNRVWPVTGPLHTDAELGLPGHHYHVDGRFVSLGAAYELRHLRDLSFAIAAQPISIFQAAVWKRRRCLRKQPIYPRQAAGGSKAFLALWAAFAGHQCKTGAAGWICPHRGTALGSLPVTDGVITCPLHGLRIEAETGRVL